MSWSLHLTIQIFPLLSRSEYLEAGKPDLLLYRFLLTIRSYSNNPGNEADVTLYLNATGLMWENMEKFGALLVFAEHRYFGESAMPFHDNMNYLSPDQALADYANLITFVLNSF